MTGFHDWKHASGKQGVVVLHDKCATIHKSAMLAWEECKRNSACGTSIASQLVAGRDLETRNNHHYLICVSQILLFCAHQEIALRGHCESYVSDNRRELMHLSGKHDSVVMEKCKEGPCNTVYTSPKMQNTLLEIMGSR